MAWKLAPALAALISDVNDQWPGRSKASDGTIGDAAHAARKSEHNPNREPGDDVPDGYVTAADITSDGIDAKRLIDAMINDRRTWYVIHKGRIRSRTYQFADRPYTGSNPHNGHIHISLNQNQRDCDDQAAWLAPKVKETPYQRIARIAHQRAVKIRNLRRRLRRK